MKYFATVKHHSVIGYWTEIEATSLTDAKRKATKDYGNGYHDHIINLVECENTPPTGMLNDIPAHCKVIGSSEGWVAPC
jgi:hypothetical protein